MLSSYVSPFLLKSNILKKLYENQQNEIDTLNIDIHDLLNQCYVETATWGLIYWEKEFGIETVLSDSYEIRRGRLKAKLRGQGTTTREMIKKIIRSWSNSEVEILESSTYSSLNNFKYEELNSKTHDDLDGEYYEIKIFFVDSVGTPPQMQDVYNAINEVIPTHLNVRYIFKYLTYQTLADKTHLYLNNYSHDEIINNKI